MISTTDFSALAGDLLRQGYSVSFKAAGASMSPFIRNGDLITVVPLSPRSLRPGDIILFLRKNGAPVAHRVMDISRLSSASVVLARGDAGQAPLESVPVSRIVGTVVRATRNGHPIRLSGRLLRLAALLWARLQPLPFVLVRARNALRSSLPRRPGKFYVFPDQAANLRPRKKL